MRIKSIELNGKELPKRFVVYLSSDELNLIDEYSANHSAEALEDSETPSGLKLKLSAKLAAQITSFTGKLTSETVPRQTHASNEIFDGFSSIFNRFYEDGYDEVL